MFASFAAVFALRQDQYLGGFIRLIISRVRTKNIFHAISCSIPAPLIKYVHGQNHLLTNFVKTNFPNLSISIGLYQN